MKGWKDGLRFKGEKVKRWLCHLNSLPSNLVYLECLEYLVYLENLGNLGNPVYLENLVQLEILAPPAS